MEFGFIIIFIGFVFVILSAIKKHVEQVNAKQSKEVQSPKEVGIEIDEIKPAADPFSIEEKAVVSENERRRQLAIEENKRRLAQRKAAIQPKENVVKAKDEIRTNERKELHSSLTNTMKSRLSEISSHTHTPQGKNVIVEKRYTESSIQGESTQGCVEHQEERYVVIDEIETTTEHTFLQKLIVYGDVISKPKYLDM